MRRPAAVLTLGLLAGLALTGCRTSPNVAAYVGDDTVAVDELTDAVAAHRADPEVTAGEDPDYTRTILTQLVRSEVVTSAAEHFGVSPDPGGLEDLLDQLLLPSGQDRETFFAGRAQQGFTRADSLEQVRQVAVLQAIAVEEGAVDAPSEASLRALYEQAIAQQPAQLSVGYINVPDQATADGAVAALQADPGSYAEVAAPYLALATLPAPQTIAVDDLTTQLPADLAAQVAQAQPGTVFSTPAEGVSGVLVVVVDQAPVPAFEDVRPQVEAAAVNRAAAAGTDIVTEYEKSLDIDVNPRYGVVEGDLFDDGSVVPAAGNVVQVLGTED
jgi:peptidyl-prolyl cis-trans isomerase SurA